jgi:purine-binding chemotaxis protein CheW
MTNTSAGKVIPDINSYLIFKLGNELYAINVIYVLSILELTKITKVPQAPSYMKGVINLRGSVLPLIDTRLKFGMTETEFTSSTCILVFEIKKENETIKFGALVDAVNEVTELNRNQIMPPPTIGLRYKTSFIEGMATINNEFVMILNVENIFSEDDIVDMQEVTDQIIHTINE